MHISRRKFLALTSAATALPTVALASAPHSIMQNVIAYAETVPPQFREGMIKLNQSIVDLYPQFFAHCVAGTYPITARHLNCGYTFEFAYDGLPPGFKSAHDYEAMVLESFADMAMEALAKLNQSEKLRGSTSVMVL